MLGFNSGIYFLDIRVKPEYDNYLLVIAGFSFSIVIAALSFSLVIAGLDPAIQRSPERATLVRG